MRIVIIGPKGSGKSLIGKMLSHEIGLKFYDTDEVLEEYYYKLTNNRLSFREIYREVGREEFGSIEYEAIKTLEEQDYCVISTGGSAFLNSDIRRILRARGSIIIYIHAELDILWERIIKNGIPAYLEGVDDPKLTFSNRIITNYEVCSVYSDIIYNTSYKSPEEIVGDIKDELSVEFNIRCNRPNTFGEIIRITTFGESHGKALGVILDGIKPGISIDQNYIQRELDRRRPGQSHLTTSRAEGDRVEILSGFIDGVTTGAPIGIIIRNSDMDSSKYDDLKNLFRPGHADFTFYKKFGIRDHRGGGRSSGRETVSRVASGAIAKQILGGMGVDITAYTIQIAEIKGQTVDVSFIEQNPVRSADPEKCKEMEQAIIDAKVRGDSVGGVVEVVVTGIKAGIGDPVFGKISSRLASAIFSIGSVKGVEFGLGFESAAMYGSEFNDMITEDGFTTNNSGGMLGGITNGNDIKMRIAIRPTPSIYINQKTVDLNNNPVDIQISGRHDPCIVPRVIPVIESMVALVLLDAIYVQERLISS